MTSPLLLLAEKVEGLEGPDREVDAKIGLLAGGFFLAEPRYPGAVRMYGYVDSDGCHVEPGNGGQFSLIPRYTASVDNALSLVPEGFMWRLQSWPDGVNSAMLEKDAGDFGAIDARHTEAFATTPALALVAASLRARAAMEAQ